MKKAQAGAQTLLLEDQWDAVISAGLTGALIPSTTIGTLLVAERVMQETPSSATTVFSHMVKCDSVLSEKALRTAKAIGIPSQKGGMITVPRILCTAAEKQALADRSGGIGVDMESSVIGDIAFMRHIPFIVTRTVSDLSHENLPMDFNLFQESWGIGRGMWAILSHPRSILRFATFQHQTRKALDSLSRFFQRFLAELDQYDFGHSCNS